jgi:hypothetical protein
VTSERVLEGYLMTPVSERRAFIKELYTDEFDMWTSLKERVFSATTGQTSGLKTMDDNCCEGVTTNTRTTAILLC